jgi:2,4-dienoyl-CoA reductase-like NADH-dependent reductase (Old Yellow Enzyme family)/thioredoxin reductase
VKKYPNLFSPIEIGKVKLKNRICMAPQSTPDDARGGSLTPRGRAYYETRAKGGAALVTIGETPVDFDYAAKDLNFLRLGYREPNVCDMAELKILTDSIKRHGAAASIELSHCGALNLPFALGGKAPIGPSPFDSPSGLRAVEMDEEMIERVCDNFADAAAYVKSVGFDMVMVHGGHGWLLAQFLSPLFNKRGDRFGGSLVNRARFPIMVLDRIREKCGADFPIELRISADEEYEGGFGIDEAVQFCLMLDGKVDIIHASVGTPLDPNNRTFSSIYDPNGLNASLSEAIKKAVDIPVATIGGINSPELAERLLSEGKADLIYLGRQMVADPEFPKKALEGRPEEIANCIRCMCCHAAPSPPIYLECTVNPLATREYYFGGLTRAEIPKRVFIIGGGPAGMTAAITAAKRGHDVTLFEKSGSLGGILRFCYKDIYKNDLRMFIDHLIATVGNSGVRLLLNTEATPEMVEKEKPDAVIVATGSVAAVPPIPGIENAVHALSVYEDGASLGGRVVMIGGGLAGCETALHLAGLGKKVTLIEMASELAPDSYAYHRKWMLRRLMERVDAKTNLTCTRIEAGGVYAVGKDGNEVFFEADTVVYALGMKSVSADAFRLAAPAHYSEAGDCVRPAKLKEAVHEAYFAAADL